MAHTVSYNSEMDIIETIAKGSFDMVEARETVSEICALAKENDCFRCLSDYREATLAMTISEIYEIPGLISKITSSMGLDDRRFKRAVVVGKGLDNFRFLETVSFNVGQNVRLFRDVEEAKKWLLG